MTVKYVIFLNGNDEGFWTGEIYTYRGWDLPVVTVDENNARTYKNKNRAITTAKKLINKYSWHFRTYQIKTLYLTS